MFDRMDDNGDNNGDYNEDKNDGYNGDNNDDYNGDKNDYYNGDNNNGYDGDNKQNQQQDEERDNELEAFSSMISLNTSNPLIVNQYDSGVEDVEEEVKANKKVCLSTVNVLRTENALENSDFEFCFYCIFYRLHIIENVYIIELGSGLGLGSVGLGTGAGAGDRPL